MAEKLLSDETPTEFFRRELTLAMEHQKISTSAFTEYYLVNLLARCVHGDPLPPPDPGFDETPLALLYVKALEASRHQRARLLKAAGDGALFISGFFADSIGRKLVDLAYYRTMGGSAYVRLSQEDDALGFGPAVFAELARRFTAFADLLSEVSERTRVSDNRSILVLYERWLQTGSRRAAALLAEQGLTPVNPGETRPQ